MAERSAPPTAAAALLTAAREQLLATGYSGLSTRKVAEGAQVALSQVHYHFGSKSGLVLALLRAENDRRLTRQASMYGQDTPLWRRYEQACDFLDDDLESGFVRVLQEMIAAGWSDPEIAAAARDLLRGWYALLTQVSAEAAEQLGGLGPFSPQEAAALLGNVFIGSEALLLLGFERQDLPIRSALRRLGDVLREAEQAASTARAAHGRGEADARTRA